MKYDMDAWTVVDEASGKRTSVTLSPQKRRGRKPTTKGMHDRVAKMVTYPAPRNSVRLMLGGEETPVLAARAAPVPFTERVEGHRELLERRKVPQAAETHPLDGQAARWYDHVILCVPRSGRDVARQVARLCGNDSQVTVPLRSLADAVGRRDSAGRDSAYTRRGIECLVEAGWLSTKTSGSGQNIVTTFYLIPGDRSVEWFPEDDDEWQEARL